MVITHVPERFEWDGMGINHLVPSSFKVPDNIRLENHLEPDE